MTRSRLFRTLRALGVGLLLALLGHGVALQWMQQELEGLHLAPPMERMQVTFTRLLQPSTPPQVSAAGPGAKARKRTATAPTPEAGASAPPQDESPESVAAAASAVEHAAADPAPDGASSPAAGSPTSVTGAASSAGAAASSAVAAASSAVAAVSSPASGAATGGDAEDRAAAVGVRVPWPRSTRLRYNLLGWFRGEVQGQAQVEWLRKGAHYQVHLEVSVGPSAAPLIVRRMSSDGTLSDDEGLRPRRFEQDTRQLLARSRTQVLLEGDTVQFGNGRRVDRPVEAQDTASQFIQMVYLFTVQPERARKGERFDFPLALPHKLMTWGYEVGERETVSTALGDIETVHVVPRSPAQPGVLAAEVWYAPSLQWLPVRLRIVQDAETWVDLRLARAPEQG